MIIKNIIQFLQNEDALFINDLGLIKKVYVEARLENGTIYPPHFRLELQEFNVGNGFAFVLFVSKNEQLRIVEADMAIKHWLEEVKNRIKENGKADFEGFGTFFKSKDQLVFESTIIPELNLDFEGMDAISLKEPISTSIETTANEGSETSAEETIAEKEEIEEEKIEEKEKTEAEETQLEKEVELPHRKKRSYRTMSLILFIVLILGALVFIFYLFKDVLELQWHTYQWKKEIYPQQVDTTLQHTREVAADFSEDSLHVSEIEGDTLFHHEESTFDYLAEKKNASTLQKIDFESGKFYVIAGSFDTERRATEHAYLKEKQGLTPMLLYQAGTSKIRICIGIYSTEEEAFRSIEYSKDFWILK